MPAVAAVLALAACARTGFPEGGPVDASPPALVSSIPADKATNVPREVQIEFLYDEPLGQGVQAQAGRLVLLNPDRPEVVTNAGGKKIEIQPRSPLEPETTYTVVVNPGLPDRRNNATKASSRIVFSTGAALTQTLLRGSVTLGGKPAPGANVYALNQERGFGYRAFADSSGAFELLSVALGKYLVRAWNETNGEEGFQFTVEAGDSALGEIPRPGAGLELEMNLVVADTSAPRLVRAEPVARDGLLLTFSDTLAADQAFEPARAHVLALPPEVAPRGTALDSVPQSAVHGEALPVEEVRYDSLEPRSLLLRLGPSLADSAAFAARVGGVRNTAGLVAPDEPPWLLFRTRVVPDSTVAPAPAATGAAAPPGKLPGRERTRREPTRAGERAPTPPRPEGAAPDTIPRADTLAPKDTLAPRDTLASRDTLAPGDTLVPRDTLAPGDTITPKDTVAPRDSVAPGRSRDGDGA